MVIRYYVPINQQLYGQKPNSKTQKGWKKKKKKKESPKLTFLKKNSYHQYHQT